MEKGIVKWTPKELTKPRPVSHYPSPIVTRALALVHKQVMLTPGAGQLNTNKANYPASADSQPDDVADLIRHCAVHKGQPYAMRLVKSSAGVWQCAQAIRISDSLYWEQYTDAPAVSVPSYVIREDERCAVCGATGRSAIYCPSCKRFMCWGKTVNRWFRCACEFEGELEQRALVHRGVVPSVRF